MSTEIQAFKGFDQNLQCRGFQFEPGKTYQHDGRVKACESGFHACEHPLDVFGYYSPASSRFFAVTLSGAISRETSDSKIAAATLTLGAELKLPDIIAAAIKYVFDRSKPEQGSSATGDAGAASATGDAGAASATGDAGAASATGYAGAASATGTRGAASATGTRGAASATGYAGAASATGTRGAASATGYAGRVMGEKGCAMFLVYRDPNTYEIKHAWAGIAGKNRIKPNVWYTLSEAGKPVVVNS